MDAALQTLLAFALVALATGYLLWTWLRPKKTPGCGQSGACAAVPPEVRKLQRRLRAR